MVRAWGWSLFVPHPSLSDCQSLFVPHPSPSDCQSLCVPLPSPSDCQAPVSSSSSLSSMLVCAWSCLGRPQLHVSGEEELELLLWM